MPNYTHLGGTFWKSETEVFAEWQRTQLDPAKVQVAFDTWATDGRRVYNGPNLRRAIDAATFVPLNPLYAKDAKRCYSDSVDAQKAIAGADPASFEALDSGLECRLLTFGEQIASGYARDKDHVYFNGNLVKNADVATFLSLGECFGRDRQHVYFSGVRLNKAQPLRWRNLGGEFSRDDNHVYWQHKEIKNVDLPHFHRVEPYDNEYAYDGRRFYYRDGPCSEEDYLATLRLHADSLARLIERVTSGDWQQSLTEGQRHYRQPDEMLIFFNEIEPGETQSKVEAKLGPGAEVQPSKWNRYFRFVSNGQELPPPAAAQVFSWTHGDEILVCLFEDGKVTSRLVTSREDVDA